MDDLNSARVKEWLDEGFALVHALLKDADKANASNRELASMAMDLGQAMGVLHGKLDEALRLTRRGRNA